MSGPGTARTVGPYTLGRELGRGGMGVVHEALGPGGQTVALKLLLERNGDALKRFEREARALGALNHRNIIRVHTYGQAPEGPYLVTELVPGESLERVCARGPLPPERAAEIVRQLADAVARAHAAGVLHRDLKPQNVILRPDGAPVLLDFGLARAESAERLTQTGDLVGTPAYMAPEQAGEGAQALDERVDVYGLGAVLFYLLNARPPFDADGPVQLVKKVIFDEPEWPSASASPALEAVCSKAMTKDRQGRYASAAALRDELARFLRGEATQAQPRAARSVLPMIVGAGVLLAVVTGLALAARRPAVPTEEAPPPDVAAESSTGRREEDPVRKAERALRATKEPRAVARAAARLLELSPGHDLAERLLDEARQRPCWSVSLGAPSGARFLPGGDLVLTTGGGTARVWDVGQPAESGPIASRAIGRDMTHPAIDPGRSCAWMASAGQVLALALPSLEDVGTPIPLPTDHRWAVARAVKCSRDGAWLAVAHDLDAGQSVVVLVDLAARRATVVERYEHPLRDAMVDRAGALWAVGGRLGGKDDGWDLRQAIDVFEDGVRAPWPGPGVGVPMFTAEAPDGAVVIGTGMSELRLLDRARKSEVKLRSGVLEKRRRGAEDGSEVPTFYDGVGFGGRWLIVAQAKSENGRDEDDAVLVYDLAGADARMVDQERLEPAWTVVVPSTIRSPIEVDVSDDGELLFMLCADGELLVYPFFPPP